MSETEGVCKGVLGIIACPMLEDELIYDLLTDSQEKDIYLVDGPQSRTVKPKLDSYGIRYTLVDEYTFWNRSEDLDRNRYSIMILMNDLGLHSEPESLKSKLEEQVMLSKGKFDVLALFYGTCGNAFWDLPEWARKNETGMPVFVFRDNDGKVCDDCIGVAVGGNERYFRLLKTYTGMLLVTPAVATNWDSFISSSEMMKGIGKDNHEMMRWLFEVCGYEYAVKIDTGLGDRKNYQQCAEALCADMNLKLIEADEGWATVELAKKIYRESKEALISKNRCSARAIR